MALDDSIAKYFPDAPRSWQLIMATPAKAAPDALCARAVLRGSNGTEPETAGAVPHL
jgi:hypothetical protein